MFTEKQLGASHWKRGITPTVNESMMVYRYREVAESLDKLLSQPLVTDCDISKHLLSAAYNLVQACASCRADADFHKEISDRATEVENQLKQQLFSLVDVTSVAYLTDRGSASDPSVAEHISTQTNAFSQTQCAAEDTTVERFLALAKTDATATPLCDQACDSVDQVHVLNVYCLGAFRVFVNDSLVADWPNCKSKSVFKYLVAHRARPVSKEVLMETFWANAEPEPSRNSLNVAICNARKALAQYGSEYSFIEFSDGCYAIGPKLTVWVDVDTFRQHCANARRLDARGDRAAAAKEYRVAESLYQGDFLADDRYDDWLFETRQQLREEYIGLLTYLSNYGLSQDNQELCVASCEKLLLTDACNEAAHRRLMRCYAQLGQTHLAIRQYHLCIEALSRELGLQPSLKTVELFQNIRRHRAV
jgi:DNA-binding SARP family transcriptional activator